MKIPSFFKMREDILEKTAGWEKKTGCEATQFVETLKVGLSMAVVTLWPPFQVSSTMTPLIVTEVEAFWKPEPWFVVVLTATGAAFFLALGWLLSWILRGYVSISVLPASQPTHIHTLTPIGGCTHYLMALPTLTGKQIEKGSYGLFRSTQAERHWKWSGFGIRRT